MRVNANQKLATPKQVDLERKLLLCLTVDTVGPDQGDPFFFGTIAESILFPTTAGTPPVPDPPLMNPWAHTGPA